jgi:methionyl-tRNA formyltransferase
VNCVSNFIFFGEDAFSLVVLKSLVEGCEGLRPVAAVMLEPLSVSGLRLAAYCESSNIPLIKTRSVKSEEFLVLLDGLAYDLVVITHFQRVLPARIFSRAKIGALNLHPSLLPKYRGMSPQHWPIILGDIETGVTVHCIDEGVDTGRIIRQVRIPLDPDTYIHELQAKFLDVYRTIMIEAVERLLSGEMGLEQSATGASYFHKIHESDMKISLEMGVTRAYALVRAFSFPYDGAQLGNIRIMKARPASDEVWLGSKGSAGPIGLHTIETRRYLILKDGALEITKWRNA